MKTCGPVIMFGMGGKDAELIKDFACRTAAAQSSAGTRDSGTDARLQRLGKRVAEPASGQYTPINGYYGKSLDLIVDFPENKRTRYQSSCREWRYRVGPGYTYCPRRRRYQKGCPGTRASYYFALSAHYITPWQTNDCRNVLLRPVKPEDEDLERKALERLFGRIAAIPVF